MFKSVNVHIYNRYICMYMYVCVLTELYFNIYFKDTRVTDTIVYTLEKREREKISSTIN